ncbi:hypothetical protein E0H75_06785 [Kribbella capetownensis]|uniref:Uncharacterized protein n=1 Tax=Kribbella capetownensis TaxID=1572659 RepID=A0A4R0K3U2_9ACTN|nr:hypothetical protein [Kribbella capetownensis]TCC53404.1 hypothetical protein E0H75_06785 [Kribbella capetownensis]
MARRGTVGALLGSGLVVITALGGAGGYGVGLLIGEAQPAVASGAAAPLGTASPTPSGTPTPAAPTRTPKPDNRPALQADDISYKTRSFTAELVVKSHVSARVPYNWRITQPDPPNYARFTDPTSKRWIRIEAGFTISRPPAASMAARIKDLNTLDKNQLLTIVSQQVEDDQATLAYTYLPPESQTSEGVIRYVIVRWVADDSGLCAIEMSSTGLPQDKDALLDVLDHASKSVVRRDTP